MTKTDDELRQLDFAALLRFGLPAKGRMRAALFGEGIVGAAVTLDRLGVFPRSVSFLAKVVRSGGVAYAAELDAPLPGEEPTRTARDWLVSASAVARTVDDDETVARWFEAVSAVMALRRATRAAA